MCSQVSSPRFARIMFISLLTLTACAAAQIQAPLGWTVQPIQNAVLLNSPPSWSSPSLILTLLSPRVTTGPAETWFAAETITLSRAGGQPVAASNVMRHGPLLIRAVRIQTPREMERVVFYSYPAAGLQQRVALIIPAGVADNDPRFDTVDQYVEILAARRIDLGGVLASVSAGPQFAVPGVPPSAAAGASQPASSYDQTESLKHFSTTMMYSTIDQMRAMSH